MSSVEHPAFAAPRKPNIIRRWWNFYRRPAIPPTLGWPLATAWTLMLLPAVLGVALTLDFGAVLLLMLPAFVLHARLGRAEAKARGVVNRMPFSPLSVVVGFVTSVITQLPDRRYLALISIAVFILILEPTDRLVWRRRLRDLSS